MKTFDKDMLLKLLSKKTGNQQKTNKLYKRLTGEEAPKGGGKK